jgi:tetratricopeptide (TPR) repeat protein
MDPGDGGSGGNLEMLYLRSALNKVQAGDYESARRYFEAALDLVSDLAPAYTSLAYLHLLEANYELALEDALIAYELNPADGSIYFVLGEIHFAMEDYAAAQSNYETYQLWVELAEAEPILIRQLLGEDSMDIVNEHLGMSIAKRSQEATS